MAKNLGDCGTKIYYFIRKNKAENGPLEFRTVLCSNYDEKLGNLEKKTLAEVVFAEIRGISCILACQVQKMAKNRVVFVFRH